MKNRILYFLLYALYWIVLFELSRVIFLIYHYHYSMELSFGDLLLILIHGFKMDFSMTGYLLVLPGLLLVASPYLKNTLVYESMKWYTMIMLFIVTLIFVSDMELYRYWGFRLDSTPLLYLANPKEVFGSSKLSALIILILLWIFMFIAYFFIFNKFIGKVVNAFEPTNWKVSAAFVFLTAFLILPIRGSLGQSNMNAGFVYFHKSSIYANQAAINVVWNVGYSLSKFWKSKYPENFFNKEKTETYFRELYPDEISTADILNTDRPNVIIIALENFTSKIVGVLGGVEGITPNLDRLSKEGILFNNIYSSGNRTDKGVVSILSGYPAQPSTSIIKFPKKTSTLPYITTELKKMGYFTGFTYGVDIDYANFRSYLINAKFDDIKSRDDFDGNGGSKWGIHDHVVLNKILDELDSTPEPFLKCTMTLSSHEPFEVPMETVIEGNSHVNLFLNSAYYADKSIGEFIARAKTKKWWKNTLIIMVADHGTFVINDDKYSDKNSFKIVMLWLGGALKEKGIVIPKIGSQTDIAGTLLSLLKVKHDNFEFSKDLFAANSKSFAFYTFKNGFGFVNDSVDLVYDNDARIFMHEQGNSENTKEFAKAYMQKLYSDFNQR